MVEFKEVPDLLPERLLDASHGLVYAELALVGVQLSLAPVPTLALSKAAAMRRPRFVRSTSGFQEAR